MLFILYTPNGAAVHIIYNLYEYYLVYFLFLRKVSNIVGQ